MRKYHSHAIQTDEALKALALPMFQKNLTSQFIFVLVVAD